MAVKGTLVWGIVGATSLALALPLGGMLAAADPASPAPISIAPTAAPQVVARVASLVESHVKSGIVPASEAPAKSGMAPAESPLKTGAVPPPPPPPPPLPAPAVPGCAQNASGTTGPAPGIVSPGGVGGTTSADLADFAVAFNAIRIANCMTAVPFSNFRYDACMEQRLFWIAEDPSTDIRSAWGHLGSVRSDGVPSVGCDGNLAGGLDNTGATFAHKWWDSMSHRLSLYKPGETGLTADVCISFAMTHGGVPDEPYSFSRGAARWGAC